jgi:hypothetical protein
MSSEVVHAVRTSAPWKPSFGIVGTLRCRNCPLIGFGNLTVRAERPSRSRIWSGGPGRRFPASPNESRSRLVLPPAGRAMRAVQVGTGFGSSRSGRVKWCHEKRCLVTIAAARSAPSRARARTACGKFDDKGCGENAGVHTISVASPAQTGIAHRLLLQICRRFNTRGAVVHVCTFCL